MSFTHSFIDENFQNLFILNRLKYHLSGLLRFWFAYPLALAIFAFLVTCFPLSLALGTVHLNNLHSRSCLNTSGINCTSITTFALWLISLKNQLLMTIAILVTNSLTIMKSAGIHGSKRKGPSECEILRQFKWPFTLAQDRRFKGTLISEIRDFRSHDFWKLIMPDCFLGQLESVAVSGYPVTSSMMT